MKYLLRVDQKKVYIKWFMILINEKNVYETVYQPHKPFWRVFYSTLIFICVEEIFVVSDLLKSEFCGKQKLLEIEQVK